jgi:hypothetical protein
MKTANKMGRIGTPMNPIPQQLVNKKLPPKVLPLKCKIDMEKYIQSILPRTSCDMPELSGAPSESIVKNQKLPKISAKNHSNHTSNKRFSKYVPRFQTFKPLFHNRNRSSYNVPNIDDEEYMSVSMDIIYNIL